MARRDTKYTYLIKIRCSQARLKKLDQKSWTSPSIANLVIIFLAVTCLVAIVRGYNNNTSVSRSRRRNIGHKKTR